MPTTTANPRLHAFAVFTAVATLVLILAGGLVTSKGAGMAVPDWPNTFGYNMFFFPIDHWVGGVFYEHTHRLLGSFVGLLTVVLALWLHGSNARRFLRVVGFLLLVGAALILFNWAARWSDALVLGITGMAAVGSSFCWPSVSPAPKWLRRLGLIAVVAVIVQGVLGGLRVTQIMDELGIVHGALAQLFFVLICAIALFTSGWWARFSAQLSSSSGETISRPLAISYLAATFLIFAQLLVGATMRHQHAGLAVPDFPLAYGKLWPDTSAQAIERYNQQRLEIFSVKSITAGHVYLHMAHRITAVAILALIIVTAVATARAAKANTAQRRLTVGWVALIGIQVLLGAWTVWSEKAADVATAHVLVGVLSLATGALLCVITMRELFASREPAAATAGFSPLLRPRPQ